MSITVSGADATYTDITYGGNTGTLYEFINPAIPGSFTVTGTLSSAYATAWLIGGGGGGGGGSVDPGSKGGGGGGGDVITSFDLGASELFTSGTYGINVGNGGYGGDADTEQGNNGISGTDSSITTSGSSIVIQAYGGGYGSGGDSSNSGAMSGSGANGGSYPGGGGGAGVTNSLTTGNYGGGGGGGGGNTNNAGSGGSANASGTNNGSTVSGVLIDDFTGASLPATFLYTFGDGGGVYGGAQGGGYGAGGNGGASGGNANSGVSGAVYIFVVDPPSNDLEFGVVSNITSSGFTVEFFGGDGTGVTYTANASKDLVNYDAPFDSGTVDPITKIITFTGLESSTSYGIVLTASNGGGEVVISADLDANGDPFTTSAGGVPSTPSVLTLVSKTSTSITVSGDITGVDGSPFTGAEFYSQTGEGYDILNTNISSETGGILTIEYTGLSPSTTYNLKWLLKNSSGSGSASDPLTVTTLSGGNPPCFLRGSKILCLKENKEQYVAVEDMRVGMEVKTLKGTYVKVHTIGNKMFNNPDNADRGPNRLFRLTPSNYPELTEDLIITGCHSRLVEKLEPQQKARHLQLMKNLYMTTDMFRLMAFIDEKAEPYQNPGKHEIWHFALENEVEVCNYGVYANGGLLVETASIKNMRERSGLALIE